MTFVPKEEPKGASVSAGMAIGIVDFAIANGANREALLTQCEISPSALFDADNRIPLHQYRDLVRTAARDCCDPAFSLTWGAAVDMADLSVVGLIMRASPTMGDAFLQLQRYAQLAIEFRENSDTPRFVLKPVGEALWMVDTRSDANEFHELSESSFARLTCGPRSFLDQPHVLEVHFTHPETSYTDVYADVFQCPITFSSHWNAMRLHPDIASWSVSREPSYVFGILTEHAERQLESIESCTSIRGAVERAVRAILHTGDFTSESIARTLGFSRQSLYRRLKGEQTSFAAIVDGLRERLATQYLAAKKTSVNETAYLLGYSDPASFSRAYKRWTGTTPRDVR